MSCKIANNLRQVEAVCRVFNGKTFLEKLFHVRVKSQFTASHSSHETLGGRKIFLKMKSIFLTANTHLVLTSGFFTCNPFNQMNLFDRNLP